MGSGEGSLCAGNTMQFEACSHAIRVGYGRAFLGNMRSQAIDSTFGEILAALPTGMLIAVAIILEFGSPLEIFEDEGVRFPTH